MKLQTTIFSVAVILCGTLSLQTVGAQNQVEDMVWKSLSNELAKATVADSVATPDSVIVPDSISTPYDRETAGLKWSLPLVFDAGIPIRLNREWLADNTLASVPQSWTTAIQSRPEQYMDSLRAGTKHSIATNRIDMVQFDAATLPSIEKIEVALEAAPKQKWKVAPTQQMVVSLPVNEAITQKDYKYSNWKFTGHLSAQASQTYISPNWSSGGTTNSTLLLSAYATIKYDDRKLIQFDNVFDLQLGFNTNASDTIRRMSVGTDQLQISSKLGIKAFNKWYYSLQAELITQVADNYKANTYDLKSSFMSPAKFFVSLGLDYKLSTDKMNLSVLLTPLTYKLNYVRETDKIDPTSYGIEAGKHVGHEFGIKLSSTFNWTITDNISWNTYLYYYSNFGYIDSEWKNTFNFKISRFFTAQVFLHTKYDDRIKRSEEQKTLLQFKDIISVGFTYHFPSFRFQ